MLKRIVFFLLISYYSNAQLHHSTISGQSATVDKYNVKVLTWTVNDTNRISKLISWAVDGIITDYPEYVIKP